MYWVQDSLKPFIRKPWLLNLLSEASPLNVRKNLKSSMKEMNSSRLIELILSVMVILLLN